MGQLLLLLLLQPPPLELIDNREVYVSSVRRASSLHQGAVLSPLLVLEHPHILFDFGGLLLDKVLYVRARLRDGPFELPWADFTLREIVLDQTRLLIDRKPNDAWLFILLKLLRCFFA